MTTSLLAEQTVHNNLSKHLECAFEQTRERSGACGIERLPAFLVNIASMCSPADNALQQLGLNRDRFFEMMKIQAAAWFRKNATPF